MTPLTRDFKMTAKLIRCDSPWYTSVRQKTVPVVEDITNAAALPTLFLFR